MQPLNNYEKRFLFYLKGSFRSQDIEIFVFLSSSRLFPIGHCFRGWLKINLTVHDVTNCLNRNLITSFVCCFEKEKRYDIETLSIDRVLDKKDLHGKNYTENVQQKLVLDPFSILVNNPKQLLHAGVLLQIRYLKRGYLKALKSITFFFWTVYHPHVTSMYSYVIRMSLVCHPYVTHLWFYHEPAANAKESRLCAGPYPTQDKLLVAFHWDLNMCLSQILSNLLSIPNSMESKTPFILKYLVVFISLQ